MVSFAGTVRLKWTVVRSPMNERMMKTVISVSSLLLKLMVEMWLLK